MTNSLRKIVNKVFNAHKSPGDMDRKCMHSALKTVKTYLSNGGDIYQWAVKKMGIHLYLLKTFLCPAWRFSALQHFEHCLQGCVTVLHKPRIQRFCFLYSCRREQVQVALSGPTLHCTHWCLALCVCITRTQNEDQSKGFIPGIAWWWNTWLDIIIFTPYRLQSECLNYAFEFLPNITWLQNS